MALHKIKISHQFAISILTVLTVSGICWSLKDYLDYRIVALILLLVVSVLAVSFKILPVLIAALLSALLLNYIFIEPYMTYEIDNAENALLFFMFVAVALVNAVLTNRLRIQEKKARIREEKENTIKLYNTLLNSLSHELKTPISTIIGAIDTLTENNGSLTKEQEDDLLAEIDIAGSRLNIQVENLLNMSRLEAGNLRLKKDWTDINELVFLAIEKVENPENKQISFEPSEKLPLVLLDSGLVEIVLYSIIHNAIRYTPPFAIVYITAAYQDDLLKISIEDNGKGIPPEESTRVFEKFYRMPNSGTGGSGLGLSIAKGFVQAHKGKISLESSSFGGAAFKISIPVEASYIKNLKNE
ncbi:MAG: PAS domain-containing sensor histidine kinase [Chitinophagaceae bacterium]|nr:PAS domain-containing sensor histidine kinase [Chitinophagaceae bacterium]MCW5926995.1 PAS domain-containing sensor histidine kinase [Chitinophagaceae bacterium]